MGLIGNDTSIFMKRVKELFLENFSHNDLIGSRVGLVTNYTELSIADLLDKAANILEVGGWIQELYRSPYGHCLLGSIVYSSSDDKLTGYAMVYLYKYMRHHGYFDIDVGNAAVWNDAEGREEFEVIELLRQAAKEWRSENGL